MSCGPPLTLMKRTTLPVLTVSVAGSKAALLVPSPVIFTSTTAVGVAVAAAGAGAAFAVATAACEASPFFSPPQAATPNTASVLSTVQRIADLLRSLRCELVNAFTIYPPPSKAGALDPLRFSSLPTTLEPMPAPAFSQMRPEDLALRLDRGERVQLLDIRATERVAQVRVTFGPALDFRAVPASEIYRLSSLEPLHLDRAQPVAVICGHGNSSRQATQYLRDKGFEAFSVTGGMAAWETVHLPRALSPTPTLQHVIQLDRVGKVALIADDALALTGDFLFVQSVGRPDLGGQGAAWAELLWKSLERARREWPGELLVLPAHYGSEQERRADRTVAARFDVVAATNEAAAMQDRAAFLRWIADHTTTPPDSYRTIKLANLGLLELSDVDAELVEFGPNQCAVG